MSNNTYLVDEKNITNLNFELIYISKAKYGSDWHSTPHIHPFTELFFITSGSGYFEIDRKTITVSEGDLIIINPNCYHTEKSINSNDALEYIVFGINNLALEEAQKTLVYKLFNFDDKKDEILYYLNVLIDELEHKNQNYELACKSILTLFLIYISRNSSPDLLITETSEKLNVECLKIKNYIDSNFSQDINLDFLSNMTYINKFHLVHLFTKQMGISPINYLIKKRIDESKNLLCTTNYTIKDITSIVGFSNSSYFSQMFKKVTGTSPRAYRNSSISTNAVAEP